ncbi:MAG: hypothetical protein LQ340_003161 [Diploschistes diacapsis]|nr:MAG: hypothetical protein LQ340_003161 [Diploschistes diacapsis]
MLNALVNALVREDEAIAAAPGQGAQLNMAVNLKEAESSGLSSLSGDTTRHKELHRGPALRGGGAKRTLAVFHEAGRRRLGLALAKCLGDASEAINEECKVAEDIQSAIQPRQAAQWETDPFDRLEACNIVERFYKQDLVENYLGWLAQHRNAAIEIGDDNDQNEVDAADIGLYRRWVKTARQYLRAITLNWRSMDIPFFPGSKMKPRIAYFLGKLTVNLVKISSKEPNMQVPELPSYTFKRPIAARKENAEALIREWMGITEQINKPNPFEDTYHGESVLLSLNFFKKAGKVNPDLMDFLETKDHKIERDCLGNFGESSLWSAVAQPGWLPKPYFDHVIQHARDTVTDYIDVIFRDIPLEDKRKRTRWFANMSKQTRSMIDYAAMSRMKATAKTEFLTGVPKSQRQLPPIEEKGGKGEQQEPPNLIKERGKLQTKMSSFFRRHGFI